LPRSAIQIEDAVGFGGEIGIARKDPTAVVPRANGVLVEPAPDGASRDGGDQAGLTDLAGDVGGAPAGQREIEGGRQLARKSLDLNDEVRGKKPGGDPGGNARPIRRGAPRRNACATC